MSLVGKNDGVSGLPAQRPKLRNRLPRALRDRREAGLTGLGRRGTRHERGCGARAPRPRGGAQRAAAEHQRDRP